MNTDTIFTDHQIDDIDPKKKETRVTYTYSEVVDMLAKAISEKHILIAGLQRIQNALHIDGMTKQGIADIVKETTSCILKS